MRRFLKVLFQGKPLTRVEAREAMGLVIGGTCSPEEIAGFLGALAARGETAAELAGCVEAMRRHALPFPVKRSDLIDVCGTGGDGVGTFNVSTTNAILLAAAGLGVVKHGNRAVSSQSGSADVLERLGISISGTPEEVAQRFEQTGFSFLFAPAFHPAMRSVAGVRKALGVRTLFNLLGPLANPAPVKRQVIGVYELRLVPLMIEALRELGSEEALVAFGDDGLDEISVSGPTTVARLKQGRIEHFTLTPEDFGLPRSHLEAVRGGDSTLNAGITIEILSGVKGPKRDLVVINAAAALVVAGLAESWQAGRALAEEIIDSGRASAKLKELQKTTNQEKP